MEENNGIKFCLLACFTAKIKLYALIVTAAPSFNNPCKATGTKLKEEKTNLNYNLFL
jgi:hypothetical protein